MTNLDRAVKNFMKSTDETDFSLSINDMWDNNENEEELRLKRMEEIHYKANDARVARVEAESQKRGYSSVMDFVSSEDEYVEWSLNEEKLTPIEEEYWRLWNEQFHLDWFREHGTPYRIEDDPNAKF